MRANRAGQRLYSILRRFRCLRKLFDDLDCQTCQCRSSRGATVSVAVEGPPADVVGLTSSFDVTPGQTALGSLNRVRPPEEIVQDDASSTHSTLRGERQDSYDRDRQEEHYPRLSAMPGFDGYYLIDARNGDYLGQHLRHRGSRRGVDPHRVHLGARRKARDSPRETAANQHRERREQDTRTRRGSAVVRCQRKGPRSRALAGGLADDQLVRNSDNYRRARRIPMPRGGARGTNSSMAGASTFSARPHPFDTNHPCSQGRTSSACRGSVRDFAVRSRGMPDSRLSVFAVRGFVAWISDCITGRTW